MYFDLAKHVLMAILASISSFIILYFLQLMLKKRYADHRHPIKDIFTKTHFLFLIIISAYLGSLFLKLSSENELWAWRLFVAGLAIQAGLWGNEIAQQLIRRSKLFGIVDSEVISSLGIINFLINLGLWSIITIFLLSNWGFDITALVTGLGIGGIAIALAMQNILGNLFASLSIVVDKPFTIGDNITVDTFSGIVEHIGLKTTRIRSINGELLIFSNTDLLQSRVRNFKQMSRRRVTFDLKIVMTTPIEILKELPSKIKEIVSKNKLATFERSHFIDINDYFYHFSTVYWIETPDMGTYLNIQQEINLDIVTSFTAQKISFASSTTQFIIPEER